MLAGMLSITVVVALTSAWRWSCGDVHGTRPALLLDPTILATALVIELAIALRIPELPMMVLSGQFERPVFIEAPPNSTALSWLAPSLLAPYAIYCGISAGRRTRQGDLTTAGLLLVRPYLIARCLATALAHWFPILPWPPILLVLGGTLLGLAALPLGLGIACLVDHFRPQPKNLPQAPQS